MKKRILFMAAWLMIIAMQITWGVNPALLPEEETNTYWLDAVEETPKYASTDWYTGNIGETTFTITTKADLAGLAWLVNNGIEDFKDKTITLAEDIDLSDHYWVPIGYVNVRSYNNTFQGHFDGNGKSISGLIIGTEEENPAAYAYTGLFGVVYTKNDGGASIKNLTLSAENGSEIKGKQKELSGENSSFTTALVGRIFIDTASGTEGKVEIENCVNYIPVTGGIGTHSYTGGLIGSTSVSASEANAINGYGNGTLEITNCINYAQVTGGEGMEYDAHTGGIIVSAGVAGYSTGTVPSTALLQITNCINKGVLTGGKAKRFSFTAGILANSSAQTQGKSSDDPFGSPYGEGPGEGIIVITGCANDAVITGGEGAENSHTAGIVGSGNVTHNALGFGLVSLTIADCENRAAITTASSEAYSLTAGIIANATLLGGINKEYHEDNLDEGEGTAFISITNCMNTADITGADANRTYTGGIIAFGLSSFSGEATEDCYGRLNISYCSNNANITGGTGPHHSSIGGLIGYGLSSSGGELLLSDSYSYSTIKASGGFAGGLAGALSIGWDGSYHVSSCYTSGSITGTADYAGGIAGLAAINIYANKDETLDKYRATIENCLVVMNEIQGSEAYRIVGARGVVSNDHKDFNSINYLEDIFGAGNLAWVKEGNNWTNDPDKIDGATWEGNLSGLESLLTNKGWSSTNWNIFAENHLPQLKENSDITHPLVAYPLEQEQDPEPTPVVYHTIGLALGEGIRTNYAAGNLDIADGEHFYLNFNLESPVATIDDILFLVDGVEQSPRVVGNNHFSYIINPVKGNHTVVLAMKEYPVTLPDIKGVVIDVADRLKARYGESFTFRLFLADWVDSELIRVLINGIELLPNPWRDTTLTYTIEEVTGPITITVEGVDESVHNRVIEENIRLHSSDGHLFIQTAQPQTVQVFNLAGRLITQRSLPAGTTDIALTEGLYLIRIANQTYKVGVKN